MITKSIAKGGSVSFSVATFCSQLFWSNKWILGHVGAFIVLHKSAEVILFCRRQPATPIHSGQISFF